MYSAAFIYQSSEYDSDFHRLNDEIKRVAQSSPGFLGVESWQSPDGARSNATYYWSDLETLKAFSNHPTHVEAKRQYARWYSGYHIVISEVVRSYGNGSLEHVTPNDRHAPPSISATGSFHVKITSQAAEDGVGDPLVGRLALDKTFEGDLVAESRGQMLAVRTATAGSAGYVAMERVVGTLGGRSGSFALQHSGTMQRGDAELSVTVVPDSGTGELAGIAGRMRIIVADANHSYEFDYTL